jgi:hypothetical protein
MQRVAGARFGILIAVVSLTAILLVGPSIASARPSSVCVPAAPRASIDNNWGWGGSGSWGMAGQPVRYAIDVFNNDAGCGATDFVVTVSAPSGFSVSMPASTINLASLGTGYVFADVSSPTAIADGDYPITAAVSRAGASLAAPTGTSLYKVYSTDSAGPELYMAFPSDGSTISGRSTYVSVEADDDHAVRSVDVSIDGTVVATTTCDNISYACGVSYVWAIRRVHGLHAATFTATDWVGNVTTETTTFTVN